MTTWAEQARAVIDRVHGDLPEDTPLDERRKAVEAAYPFGAREHFPYKAWLKVRRSYLARYGHQPRNAAPESPMERMMRRAKAIGEHE